MIEDENSPEPRLTIDGKLRIKLVEVNTTHQPKKVLSMNKRFMSLKRDLQ